jgi:uncharacterized RDD family membrane protein YckC
VEVELATRSERLAAGLVDGLVFAGIGVVGFASLALAVFAFMLVAAINLWLLARHGASIGKRCVGIRMARSDGSEAGLARLVFLRGLARCIVTSIPYLNLLIVIDVLFIFGKRRRCLHDYLADTIVVKA